MSFAVLRGMRRKARSASASISMRYTALGAVVRLGYPSTVTRSRSTRSGMRLSAG
jgi:hypothetical protein